ncbi:DEBR0S6_03994g1_1 [Brettanomyces bruxellensis]|uniref:Sphingoid long-chain base transporter RSB1 n=1 Tax=Dekkera bruxellensis TaxID=5007 RepID=A0A7D9H400_DEKBR|nr:DEBR0S6_03994g1_1 [Brettanomyces bruxellensis]
MSSTLPSVSVETAVTIPIATITSVYASASSYYYSSLLPVMKTETNLDANVSYSNIGDELQATMSYYSLLEVQATATDPQVIVSVAAEAATASEVMNEIYKSNTMYEGKRPSLGGNLALAIVFGLMLVLQAVFGIMTKQWWFFVTYMCGIFLEVLGYSSRVWSHYNLNNFDAYVMQFVCITLAPCFLMAGIYFILAQLTVVMGQAFSILRPMQYSLIFIICDLISIVLQAAGGAMAAIELSDHKSTRSGSNVMVIGLAYQGLYNGSVPNFMVYFLLQMLYFQKTVWFQDLFQGI